MSSASLREDLDSDSNTIMRLLNSNAPDSSKRVVLKNSLQFIYKPEIIKIFTEVRIWDPISKTLKANDTAWDRLKHRLEERKKAGWRQITASAQTLRTDSESEDEDTRFDIDSSYTVVICIM